MRLHIKVSLSRMACSSLHSISLIMIHGCDIRQLGAGMHLLLRQSLQRADGLELSTLM